MGSPHMGKRGCWIFFHIWEGVVGIFVSWSRDQAMARSRIADRSRESAICAAASNASLDTDGALARVAAVGRIEAAALAAAADGVAQKIE